MALHHSVMKVLCYKILLFVVNFDFEDFKYYLWLLGGTPAGYVKIMEKGKFNF